MTQWTDDELSRLLADTFSAHEHLADPAVAHALATTVNGRQRPRRWPAYLAAAAAVGAVVAISTLAVTSQTGTAPSAPNLSPTTPSTASAGHSYAVNRADAEAESLRIVELVPLPADAVRLAALPTGWPHHYGMSLGPSDRTLTKTSWWRVPATANAFSAFLLAHTPPSMTREEGIGGGADGIHDITYIEQPAPKPEAFVAVSLLVQWRQVGQHTLVRADTFTAARAVRTGASYVEGKVTEVDVRQVLPGRGQQTGGPLPTVHLIGAADHDAITRLVRTVNKLPASIRPAPSGSCPYPGNPAPSDTITFHTTAGTIRMHFEAWCWGQVQVSRDGVPVSPTLDPGDLDRVIDQITGTSVG
jgi:hypothetical protein